MTIKPKKSVWPKVIVGIGALVVLCIVCTVMFFVIAWFGSALAEYDESTLQDGDNNQKIAVVDVRGVITRSPNVDFFGNVTPDMASTIIDELDKVQSDETIKAVILRVNSPGGEVYAAQLIKDKIEEVKAEKPVIAYFEDLAASAGYYVSAPADKIVSNETSITGSIGVLIQFQDIEGLYNKLGIQNYVVTNSNGDFKVSDPSTLGDEESEAYQIYEGILNDTFEEFVDVIEEGRPLSRQEILDIADGRVYSGKQALDLKLVDDVGLFEKAIEVAAEEADLDNPKVIEFDINTGRLTNVSSKIESYFKHLEQPDEADSVIIEYRMPY